MQDASSLTRLLMVGRYGRWLYHPSISGSSHQGNAGEASESYLAIVKPLTCESFLFAQSFKHTLFFNLLLPPIILNSGYELKQASCNRNVRQSPRNPSDF